MKTPNELNKIYNRLPKDKTELAKVELGIIDEIKSSLQNGNKGYQKAIRISDNIQSLFKALNNVVDDIDNMKSQLSNINDAENNLGSAIQQYNKVIPQAEKQAKELGVSPKDIKGYSEIKSMFNKWEESLKKLKVSQKAGINILSKIK